jgi:hypothetical protein
MHATLGNGLGAYPPLERIGLSAFASSKYALVRCIKPSGVRRNTPGVSSCARPARTNSRAATVAQRVVMAARCAVRRIVHGRRAGSAASKRSASSVSRDTAVASASVFTGQPTELRAAPAPLELRAG